MHSRMDAWCHIHCTLHQQAAGSARRFQLTVPAKLDDLHLSLAQVCVVHGLVLHPRPQQQRHLGVPEESSQRMDAHSSQVDVAKPLCAAAGMTRLEDTTKRSVAAQQVV